jgi:hypothetical protein
MARQVEIGFNCYKRAKAPCAEKAMRGRFALSRHPELVSGSSWSFVREAAAWMLKQVQHDGEQ